MSGNTGDSRYLPRVPAGLPTGERPVQAVLHARNGHEQQMALALERLVAGSLAEAGCTLFAAYRSADEPGVFYLWERFADIDAFRVHLDTPHVRVFFDALAEHSTSDGRAAVQLVEIAAG